MLLRNGGVLLFPIEVIRYIKIFAFFGTSVLSFQGTFLKRHFKAKNHIYFLGEKNKTCSLASESKNNVSLKHPRRNDIHNKEGV